MISLNIVFKKNGSFVKILWNVEAVTGNMNIYEKCLFILLNFIGIF